MAPLLACKAGADMPDRTFSTLDVGKLSDDELLRRAREGDPAAFSVLIRRHDRSLYRVARSVLLDDQEAEDVVQETYLRAITKLAGFRGDARLSTWLTRITLNEAIRRHHQRCGTIPTNRLDRAPEQGNEQSPWSSTIAPDRDPERATARRQIRKILERAIDDLPEAFRTVLVMRDVEEISTEETARILEIREGTVKTRLHRARRILRTTLGEQVASALKDLFPFEAPRCERLTKAILDQLGLPADTPLVH
jgi:RNA polymerase sigma-70 factor (ECF subfamily)